MVVHNTVTTTPKHKPTSGKPDIEVTLLALFIWLFCWQRNVQQHHNKKRD
jgi:hypothetical protein